MTKNDLMKIQKTKDFINVIQAIGYTESKGNGSHRVFRSHNRPTLTIPDGGKKEISIGVRRSIIKLILQNGYYVK
jgi:predicted RNA binding protein YcfA (HicA-like mRNA interferase family)